MSPTDDDRVAPSDPGEPEAPHESSPPAAERRTFLVRASSTAMLGGLVAGYGAFGAVAARYLYPARPTSTGWMFVVEVAALKPGSSMIYRTPEGATVVVARLAGSGDVADFIALSSTCPHLGCQVHWEAQNNRFFCPCHNGAFDAQGASTGGPPKEANQSLPRYPLKIEKGLLYIEVPLEKLAAGPSDERRGKEA